jgi:malonyl CoA-acyl carrier protein transacylase/acyl carrier protein
MIQDVRGIYYADEPLGRSGQLAFMFPGEGSQYPNMLADVCWHFPDVRRCFDIADAALPPSATSWAPSDCIFPRPAFSRAEREEAEAPLRRPAEGVHSVVLASCALLALLSRLGVRPDAVVGHSAGEYTALLASGVMGPANEAVEARIASELRLLHDTASEASEQGRAALVAVAGDYETVSGVLRPMNGRLYVGMDNCPHQVVIVGDEAAVAEAIGVLQGRGLLCERLPFDRPYHTPLFRDYSLRFEPLFAKWLTSPPTIRAYSCSTAAPLPDDLAQVRRMACEQWALPVRFRETVRALHSEGVRIFVEVGPRGSLSAFVNAILHGQPHLAIPANVASRSGVTQLNHLVGVLAAHGVDARLDCFYARRAPRKVSLDHPDDPYATGGPPRTRSRLSTGWPRMALSPETVEALRAQRASSVLSGSERATTEQMGAGFAAGAGQSAEAVMAAHMETMRKIIDTQREIMRAFLAAEGHEAPAPSDEGTGEASPGPEAAATSPDTPASQAGRAVACEGPDLGETLLRLVSERTGYPVEMIDPDLDLEAELGIDSIKRVEILSSFQRETGPFSEQDLEALSSLKTLREVIGFIATLRERGEEAVPPASAAASEGEGAPLPDAAALPLITEVTSYVPGREVAAICELEVDEHLFLRDHAFGRGVSDDDPDLPGLPVMPLTMSMELMAEAASLLAPGKVLIGMRNVRASRWIIPEHPLRLQVVATADGAEPGSAFTVRIREVEDADGSSASAAPVAIEGTMLFGELYPDAPAAEALELPEAELSRRSADYLYAQVLFQIGRASCRERV